MTLGEFIVLYTEAKLVGAAVAVAIIVGLLGLGWFLHAVLWAEPYLDDLLDEEDR